MNVTTLCKNEAVKKCIKSCKNEVIKFTYLDVRAGITHGILKNVYISDVNSIITDCESKKNLSYIIRSTTVFFIIIEICLDLYTK